MAARMTVVRTRVLLNSRDLGCDSLEAAVRWGRADPYGQPDAATATVVLADPGAALARSIDISDQLQLVVQTQAGESIRFTGFVSDVQISHPDQTTTVMAHSLMARLARIWLADQPWPEESDGDRILRILQLAGVPVAVSATWEQAQGTWHAPTVPGQPPIVVDRSPWEAQPGAWRLRRGTWRALMGTSWRQLVGPDIRPGQVTMAALDVDRRNAAELLRDTADSAAGVIFDQPNGSPAYHDAWRRTHKPEHDLSACLWLADGATFLRSLGTVVNSVTLTYGATTSGQQQESVTATMPGSIARYGPAEVRATTSLANLGDAFLIATRRARWLGWPRWAIDSLAVDSYTVPTAQALAQLLSMGLGQTVLISGVADPAPAPSLSVIIEGASERFSADSWQATYQLSDTRQTVLPFSWDEHALTDPDRAWAGVPRPTTWASADDLLLGKVT